MPYLLTITCSGCAFRQDFVPWQGLPGLGLVYRLGEGVYVPIPVVPAWCCRCRRMTQAEEVPTSDELSARYDALIRRLTRLGAPVDDVAGYRREAEQLLRWRAQRRNPSRCLGCGSSEVTLVPVVMGDPVPTMPHVGCGGELSFSWGSHYHPGGEQRVYSPEGDRIVEELKCQQAPMEGPGPWVVLA